MGSDRSARMLKVKSPDRYDLMPTFIRAFYTRRRWLIALYLISPNCRHCGRLTRIDGDRELHDSATFDHIKPRSKGGKNRHDNCTLLCHKCNNKKGNRTEGYECLTADLATIDETKREELYKRAEEILLAETHVF